MDKLKEILEFELFSTGDYSLSVFNLISIILILAVARLFIFILQALVRKSRIKRHWIDEAKEYTIIQLAKYFVYTIAVIIAIGNLGIDITILIAGSAALFVGIGLGLQSTFSDIFSGIILLFESTVSVGDVVEIDALVGTVREINLRTSKIMTRDSITMVVPNSQLVNNNVINWSHGNKTTRFRIRVSVAYGSDTEKVKEVLLDCAEKNESVLINPHPQARIADFGDSGIVFELLFWTDLTWEVEFTRSDLRFAIASAFRESGITIPFPQRDVHITPSVPETHSRKEVST